MDIFEVNVSLFSEKYNQVKDSFRKPLYKHSDLQKDNIINQSDIAIKILYGRLYYNTSTEGW